MLTCPSCGRPSAPDASFCAGCGTPLGATATVHEVRKTVTALFCDLVGSTTLGEQHDPEVLRGALEAYFDLVRTTVERHGGRVEKFIGDAVNAVFGLPTAHEDDALRAVRAGMEIQAGLADLAATSPVPLAARVGITTGEVLAPGTGRPLIGDAMNTAARLQAGAEPRSVVIGEPTWRLVRDAVAVEPLPPLAAKGKAEPVPAWRVQAVASGSPMRARRLDAPMVGRTREAAALRTAFERAASDRTCELFTVLGVAGAGKSRLVEEFLASLVGTDVEVLRGRCLSYGDGITWYPVTEALRAALDLPEFAPAEAIASAIATAVVSEEHAAALEASLAALFAAGPGSSAEEISWAVRRFLESRGRERPLIVVLDDIHWGEPAFLDLVEHLADWSRDASILLLAMARPDLLDVRPAWGGGKTNAATISLAPLTPAETSSLIEGLLGSASLPDVLNQRIVAVAEGNPLFVEELLRMLVDDGRLVRDDGRWVATADLADVAVPPTVSALLSARLDRLSDGERTVIEAAAVAGKEFHRGAVEALLPEGSVADLPVHLRSLVRKELVTPERSTILGQDAYRFRHLLIRDAAHDAIPKSTRAAFHVAFADWLETVAGDRITESQEVLAYHLERAHRYRQELGLPEDRELRLRAARALGEAGVRALDEGRAQAAVALLGPAADLAQGTREELQLLEPLAEAQFVAMDTDGRGATVQRWAEAAAVAGDDVSAIFARRAAESIALVADPKDYDLEVDRRATEADIRKLLELGASNRLPEATRWLADLEWAAGRMSSVLERAAQALDGAAVVRDRRTLEWSIGYVGTGLVEGPTPLAQAIARATMLVERFAPDRFLLLKALIERAYIASHAGHTDLARRDVSEARAISDDLGRRWDAPLYPLAEGYAAWLDEGPGAAEPPLAEAYRQNLVQGDRLNAGFFVTPLARALLDLGRWEDVEPLLADLTDNAVMLAARSHGLSLAGRIAALRGDPAAADELTSAAHRLLAGTDLLRDTADVLLDRAEVLLLAGRLDQARIAGEDALERFERKEYAIGIRRAREFLATLPS